ncbi:DapH/DapD/GlmU-related protein [Companilactobacillus sp.]|uniref:DapH/DapD/GlmU-related protein n=1 Tax=Companilactobacillus sp. TaxID=2767905 RepID=UPI0026264062|nr:DapH/DapD/GlmU-related protein [Companilactobacillus sp.]
MDALDQTLVGGRISYSKERFTEIDAIVEVNAKRTSQINNQYHDPDARRELFSQVFGYQLPETTNISAPFNTDFGRHTFIKNNVFINKDCLFVDLGGIWIDDNVLIGPRVNLVTVNHVEDPEYRRDLVTKSIHIEKNAWIGDSAMILPGVTIGENAIVGASSVVTKDVPANTIVVGSPAHVVREISE